MRIDINDFLLVLMQGIILTANFFVLKLNTNIFDTIDIGQIAFFMTTLSLISNFRLSGIDQELSRQFIREVFHFGVKSFWVVIIFSNAFAIVSIYLFDLFFVSVPIDIKLIYLYAVSFCFDRSTSLWLTSKRFIYHRFWMMLPALCSLILSSVVSVYEIGLDLYLTILLSIFTFFNFCRASLTFGDIIKLFRASETSKSNFGIHRLFPIYSRILVFSAIGFIQALNTSVERLIVGSHSLELLGEITVGMAMAIAVRELGKVVILRSVFEDALSTVRSESVKKYLLVRNFFLIFAFFFLIFIAVYFSNYVFGPAYRFGPDFAIFSAMLVLVQTILGRVLGLSGLIDDIVKISILVLTSLCSYLISIFVLLWFFEVDTANLMLFILTLSSSISLVSTFLVKEFYLNLYHILRRLRSYFR